MVLLLRLDVLHHGIELTRAHGKGTDNPAARKNRDSVLLRFDPLGEDVGEGLVLFDELSLGNSCAARRIESMRT